MKILKPLSQAEHEMLITLIGEPYPFPILDLANIADISTKHAQYLLTRICKGLRVYRTEDEEILLGIDEDTLIGQDLILPYFEEL